MATILIIGNSGFLGSFLSSFTFDGTTAVSIGRSQFDFSSPISQTFRRFLKQSCFDYAIICSAITDVEKCYLDQKISHQINVNGTIQLLDLLQENQIVPIFFSSDYVFKPNQSPNIENDERIPQTIYGLQKLIIENYLEKNFKRFLVFRTSKLMSKTKHPKNILFPIIRDLSENIEVKCFLDQWLNPVFIEDIGKIVKLAITHELSGVFNLGTRQVFTRYEMAIFLAESLGYNPKLIRSISLNDISFSEPRPTHNTLNCEKIEKVLNFQFTEIKNTINDLKSLV